MSIIFFVLLLGIFWQPIYLVIVSVYYSVHKNDIVMSSNYHSLVMPWMKKFIPLIFSNPTASPKVSIGDVNGKPLP